MSRGSDQSGTSEMRRCQRDPGPKRFTELNLRHDPDSGLQALHRSVVKIRRRHLHIAETWHFEDVKIVLRVSQIESPLVDLVAVRRGPVVARDSKFFKLGTPDIRSQMTIRAADLDELVQATDARPTRSPSRCHAGSRRSVSH